MFTYIFHEIVSTPINIEFKIQFTNLLKVLGVCNVGVQSIILSKYPQKNVITCDVKNHVMTFYVYVY
jgi:hypothetical protein